MVYGWGDLGKPDFSVVVNTNSVIEVADWANKFSGNHRLSNDVGLPLERCVIGCYQIGYLFDYINIQDKEARKSYFEEGIASVLLHLIASYEMTGREFINLCDQVFTWNEGNDCFLERKECTIKNMERMIYNISRYAFKYQRWILYNHMGRKHRWSEDEFQFCIKLVVVYCRSLAIITNSDLANGFDLCMSKIQDAEIKRH